MSRQRRINLALTATTGLLGAANGYFGLTGPNAVSLMVALFCAVVCWFGIQTHFDLNR